MSVSRATAPEADELLIDARMSPATKKKPKVRLVRPVYRGGPYSTLGVKNPRGGKNRATKGTERNHMPAWKATKDAQAVGGRTAKITQALNVVSRYTAPAVEMDIADHKKTGSWGTAGKGWRADQTRLLMQGKFKEAIAKDVQDAQAIAPGKYTKAIAEMKSKLPKEWKQLGADK